MLLLRRSFSASWSNSLFVPCKFEAIINRNYAKLKVKSKGEQPPIVVNNDSFDAEQEYLKAIEKKISRKHKEGSLKILEKLEQKISDDEIESITPTTSSIEQILKPFTEEEKEKLEKEHFQPPTNMNKDKPPKRGNHPYYLSDFQGDFFALEQILEIIEDVKALDLVVVDLRSKALFAEYMIFVTGQNFRHMKVIANRVLKELKKRKIEGLNPSIEGLDCDTWMLVDCGNIIVQIFSGEGRAYYDLERKWIFQNAGFDSNHGAQQIQLTDEAPTFQTQSNEDLELLQQETKEFKKQKKKQIRKARKKGEVDEKVNPEDDHNLIDYDAM